MRLGPATAVIQMLAPAYQLSASEQIMSRAGVSARSLAGDWRSDILFLSERLAETLFIGQPLQRLSDGPLQPRLRNSRGGRLSRRWGPNSEPSQTDPGGPPDQPGSAGVASESPHGEPTTRVRLRRRGRPGGRTGTST